jgi:formamidopyrimidine-DNA glycosylase
VPELPEVEITRRGIAPAIVGARISNVIVRHRGLRWPVPRDIARVLAGQRVNAVERRAKYLLLACDRGHVIVHLGMSGSLRVVPSAEPPGPWDHVDIVAGAHALRLRDPRRFGAVLWHEGPLERHKLLAHLGVEPLSEAFSGAVLHTHARGRRVSVKLLLMNHAIVVGVGNIYASESLFRARINPKAAAGRIARARYEALAQAVRDTLATALEAGGSSLRDFVHADGARGYFQQQYTVYDREGEPCRVCTTPIRRITQGQRSTFYCPRCQRR